MALPSKNPSYLYKILPSSFSLRPLPLLPTFILPKTSLDTDSGFIHFSTSSQVPYVLNRFFNTPETSKIWLVKIDHQKLVDDGGDVRWEVGGKDGALFAHLYGGEVMGRVVDAVRDVQRGKDWDESLKGLGEEGWLDD